ncbi:hypothetical protein J4H70_21620 [Vibrio alginolyticus]|uniref:hypothetical protein n=1 Tax=Vibrio alginolyticus TaxID=663 RepID=UPI001BD2EB98|nr:hypothetical protein [Vibrio alginolyticus]MBS9811352.1 hypothetical protein [Vibrio alginolyticus]
MWFLTDSLAPVSEDVCERGISPFLLGDAPTFISDDASISEPSFFDLPFHQREQVCRSLWQLCALPPDMAYPLSTTYILQRWLDVHQALTAPVNQWQRNALNHIELAIKTLAIDAKQSDEPLAPKELERSKLRSMLTFYPTYVTLLFIESMVDKQQATQWLWFFARLQEAVGTLTYDVCLSFDRVRREYGECPICMTTLQDASLTELYLLCQQQVGLAPLAPYFSSAKREPISSHPKTYPFKSDNAHQETMYIGDEVKVNLITPTDREGDAQSSFMEAFMPVLEADNVVEPLLISNDERPRTGQPASIPDLPRQPELTHQQARQKFLRQKVGMSQAIARANRVHPMSNDALSPSELAMWIQFHCPALAEQDLLDIPAKERSHWFLLFLRMFCGTLNLQQPLFNLGSRSTKSPPVPSLVYELDRRDACHAKLRLDTDLFKGAKPPQGSKQYFTSQKSSEVTLPWPLQSLLNLILRALPAHQRHLVSLEQGLLLTSLDHQAWLTQKIAQSCHHFPFKVTSARLTQIFHHYSSQRMPSVIADFLAGKGSVQMHYANVEGAAMTASTHQHWNAFLSAMNIQPQQGWYSETTSASIIGETYHEQCGSAITLRESLLPSAFEAILSPLFDQDAGLALSLPVENCERLALYLHIRTAIELGLRPVFSPYPVDLDCAWETGVWSLQDKRVHHKEARRLVTPSYELASLLQRYQAYACTISPQYLVQLRPVLSVFDGQDWQPLSPAVIKGLQARYLDRLEGGCFRHNALHQALLEAFKARPSFVQSELNMRMNHFKRGQYPLSQYTLCSIRQMAEVQQSLQERIAQSTYHPSVSSLWQAIADWDAKVETLLKSWTPKGVGND